MAENVVLQLILDGISALETKADLDAVKDAVKDRREVIQNLGEDVVALARGNSAEVIRVKKERYDYSNVPQKDLPMAENGTRPLDPLGSCAPPIISGAYGMRPRQLTVRT